MICQIDLPDNAITVVAAAPEWVSQHTVTEHLGPRQRQFLESLAAFAASGGEVLRLGRTRFVRPTEWIGWLRDRDQRPAVDDGDLAGELGLRVVGGE